MEDEMTRDEMIQKLRWRGSMHNHREKDGNIPIYCNDVNVLLNKWNCCGSCHDDEAEGYGGCEWGPTDIEGLTFWLCCGCSVALDKILKPTSDQPTPLTPTTNP